MNRKKKINDLYKGVFKNDKKGCLVDLKPLNNRSDQNNHPNSHSKQMNCNHINQNNELVISKNNNNHHPKHINVSLKVAKNLGFGSFFKNLREDILEVFLAKDDLISFEKMFNHKDVSDLFNFKESIIKTEKNSESTTGSFHNNNNNYLLSNNNTSLLSNNNIFNDMNETNDTTTGQEIILYEDEDKTIYKRKKVKSKMINDVNQGQGGKPRYQNNTIQMPIQMMPMQITNHHQMSMAPSLNDSFYYCQNQNTKPNHFAPMQEMNQDTHHCLFTPDKADINVGNNYTKNSVLFMNKITNCRNINGNFPSNMNYI